MDNNLEVKNRAEEAYLHTYNRFPVAFSHGEGVYLFDVNGKAYLDFGSGIGVCALGYHHPVYTAGLQAQVGKLMHTSNLFYHEEGALAAEHVKAGTGLEHVFFTNSGAEAIEGALKCAKKYAHEKGMGEEYEIIAMEHSFHGRTIGALSVTGNAHYREPFAPLLPHIRFAVFNDLDSVKALISEKTCAIILETVQGEGGIFPAQTEFLRGIRQICDEKDILLILDEIQCGMGRTGHLYAYQAYDILPDIVTTAKALGGGVPVGAFVCNEKAATLKAGDHGTTYGGNPLVCGAVNLIFDIFKREQVVARAGKMGDYLWKKLEDVKLAHPGLVLAHRGMGLMQGLGLSIAPGEVVSKALEKGLVLLSAGENTLRFLPPLVISTEDVDKMTDVLEGILSDME